MTLKKSCCEFGITEIQTHELRHSAAMLYRLHGGTKEQVSKLLNHSNTKTTEAYLHGSDEDLRALVSKVKLKKPVLRVV